MISSARADVPRSEIDAVFLDRDGTINRKAPEGSYITSPRELRLLPGAGAAVRKLHDAGLLVVVVTNQRGVALGKMTLEDVQSVNRALQGRLERYGATVDRFYVCHHATGTCGCRKPAPGLILQAVREYGWVRPAFSVVIGDAESDVQAGLTAGCMTIRLGPAGTDTRAGALWPDLAKAVEAVVVRYRGQGRLSASSR